MANWQVIVAGETATGVWCVPCNASVAVRVDLHSGDTASLPAAQLTVCASCGTRFIPATPQVTITATPQPRRRRPRPWLAFTWWRYHRECTRRGLSPTGCAVTSCPRPGWHDCAWYQPVDGGRIRWVFCGRKHRRQWLTQTSDDETAVTIL
jgi:hypothetical protein